MENMDAALSRMEKAASLLGLTGVGGSIPRGGGGGATSGNLTPHFPRGMGPPGECYALRGTVKAWRGNRRMVAGACEGRGVAQRRWNRACNRTSIGTARRKEHIARISALWAAVRSRHRMMPYATYTRKDSPFDDAPSPD